MDDTQRIVKCGNLSLHSSGGFFKKRWHSKYLVLYDGSKSGVKRLELFDSEIKFKKQNPAKIIPLVDCVRVVTCQRNKTTYTFEVRTSDQFYLLAGQSFQDMNDWVNCLRLVAFGSQQSQATTTATTTTATSASTQLVESAQLQLQPTNQHHHHHQQLDSAQRKSSTSQLGSNPKRAIDVLLEKRNLQSPIGSRSSENVRMLDKTVGQVTSQQQAPSVPTETHPALTNSSSQRITTASQAAALAASALVKTRQRQPSLLGSCKPQPPTDSPFIQQATSVGTASVCDPLTGLGQLDTLTPTVRGQLIAGATKTPLAANGLTSSGNQRPSAGVASKAPLVAATLDEEEENMLYCSIEDNPSEHNYRVKVIETELSLRCQLKCYQLTAPTTINQQYEQLGHFNSNNKAHTGNRYNETEPMPQVTFYQLIIGPQELTLLNDYAALTLKQQQQATIQQQGLWSWPYQCIRRYGFDKDNCFMFEAGRKCTSGPGQFIVQTPKAYSIYQDVVKFVNELRSLSTVDVGNTLPAGINNKDISGKIGGGEENLADRSRQQANVMQIPVTWTPTSTTGANKVDTTESREQFFNTLRQLDSSGTQSLASQVLDKAPTGARIPPSSNASHTTTIPAAPTSSTTTTAITTTTSQSPTINQKANNGKSLTTTLETTTTSHQTILPDHNNHRQHHSSASPISTDTLQSAKSLSALSSSPAKEACDSVASPEETDESGYDQGDESVDSGKSRSKFVGAAARKRQAQDSMSSASSTSSGGSPGHSVSRRSNGGVTGHPSLNGQGPSKRPPLTTVSGHCQPSTAPNGGSPKGVGQRRISTKGSGGLSDRQQLLGMLVGGNLGQPENFEANLIRDVYSEITKLHATFAVATCSTDDSMSNNSSNEESTNSSDQFGPSEQSEVANDSGLGGRHDSEPMYSNLQVRRFPRGANRIGTDLEDDDGVYDDEDESDDRHLSDLNGGKTYFQNSPGRHQQHHYQHPTDHLNHQRHSNTTASYVQKPGGFDYLSLPRCGPMYPTMLNPIPECGEVIPQQPLSASQRLISTAAGKESNHDGIRNSKRPDETNQKDSSNQRSAKVPSLLKSKIPTNHYVINDVQYAKISRNICSKYESCL